MTFTNDERRMLILYFSGSIADTTDTLRLALRDISDSDERVAVVSVLRKLDSIDYSVVESLVAESEGSYAG